MFGYRLAELLSKVPSTYKTVQEICFIENIPQKIKQRHFVIVLIKHDDNIGHWAAVYRSQKHVYELFDSCGCNKSALRFYKQHLKIADVLLYFNETRLQSKASSTCGDFVLYYTVHRSFNTDLPFTDLLNLVFSNNITKNEAAVKHFVKSVRKGKFA